MSDAWSSDVVDGDQGTRGKRRPRCGRHRNRGTPRPVPASSATGGEHSDRGARGGRSPRPDNPELFLSTPPPLMW